MESENVKRIYDACKEATDISQDIQKQQQSIKYDIDKIDNVLHINNLQEMTNAITFVFCKYPDIAYFINSDQKRILATMIMTNTSSIAVYQRSLSMLKEALQNMMACYRVHRIVAGRVKLEVKQAIEAIINKN